MLANVSKVAAIAIATTTLFLIGVVGVMHGSPGGIFDFAHFYSAGKCWLAQQSPYDAETYRAFYYQYIGSETPDAFYYPPSFAPYCLFVALFSLAQARVIGIVLNMAAVVALVLLTTRLVLDANVPRPASSMNLTKWLLPFILMTNAFMGELIWQGQVSIPLGVLLVLGWYCFQHDKPIWAGLLFGIASFKPQFIVLPLLWIALERRWLTVAISIGTASLLSVYSVWVSGGVLGSVSGWLSSLAAYQEVNAGNAPGMPMVAGIPSFLAGLGISTPSTFILIAIAALLVTVVWTQRSRLNPDDLLAILMSIQFIFVYAKVSEIALLLAPLSAALWLHIGHRRKLWPAATVALFFLFLPRRVVASLDIPILIHWRTGILLLLLCSLLWFSLAPVRAQSTQPYLLRK